MLLAVSDEPLPKIMIKKDIKINVKYIKRHWIGLDNKEQKKSNSNNNNNKNNSNSNNINNSNNKNL